MIVYKIPEKTALEIKGRRYADGITFNPIQDINENWIITSEELSQWNINLHFEILEELEAIEFEQKENPPLFGVS